MAPHAAPSAPRRRHREAAIFTLTRRALTMSALAAVIAEAAAAAPADAFADAAASDPVTLGWMQGSPPPPDRRIAFHDGSFFRFPQTRWSFSNWRVFLPTVAVSRGPGPASPLPRALRDDLDAVRLTPIGAATDISFRQSLDAAYTDAIVVLHRGRIVYERYFGVTTPETQHILFSVTKSFVGLIAESLIAEGRIDPDRPVAAYLPELAQSGFGDAAVRQVMDMTTALAFDENYVSPQSGIAAYTAAGRLAPRPATYGGPEGVYAFAATVARDGDHGARFVYRTINTEVLAWIVSRVEGKGFDRVLADRVWSRLGMEGDAAITVDGVGTPTAGGGLLARLRDLARFGEAMRLGGVAGGRRVFPARAISNITAGGARDRFPAAVYPTLPGASYRAQWWITHNINAAYMARGIHGQNLYIDPAAGMVIARVASHPIAGNVANDPITLPAYQAIADALVGARRSG